ncbi:hypothetical protein DN748_11180 [Sinomicrobium soli]|nr:hypothetical protein DN748_11180 [Sinomicrobium sp. N-1-3-6]
MYPRLLSFCLKYVNDRSVADEIVEDCMFYLWERKRDMEKVKDLKSYLYMMVRNKALAYLKQHRRVVRMEAHSETVPDIDEGYVVEEEVHAILMAALDTLPEKCRRVFELSCLEGIRYKDIAEDMNISVNTVKSQRARAIELLKIRLKDYPVLMVYLSFLLKDQIF